MRMGSRGPALRAGVLLTVLWAVSPVLPAQEPGVDGPWFGLATPPPLTPHTLPVLGTRPAVPPRRPADVERRDELTGEAVRARLETIVAFSHASRREREIGHGQLWGRITGWPSGAATVAWATEQLRAAGIADVELQTFRQEPETALWLPLEWEVSLIGLPAFGAGTQDVLLDSAMPVSVGPEPTVDLTAQLVHVGTASAAELVDVDVQGKIAVQKVIPQGHTVFVRRPVGPRAEALLDRGAVAVLRVIDLPGNLRVRDVGCRGGTCVNLGGRDGHFLEAVMNAAAETDVLDQLQGRLRVTSERVAGRSAANGVAVIPGTTHPDEYVVVNAHADAWFDGAGDNGDGLAVLLALARHFAAVEPGLPRSLVFVASAGHHTPGLSGPRHFLSMNPDVAGGTVLVINLEHTALRHITPARSEHADGYRQWVMDAREAPIVAGMTGPPALAARVEDVVHRSLVRYGTNFVAEANPMASGEGGAFRRAGLPVFTAMQGSPMYHTTGEVLELVSTPGLERMARSVADLIREVAQADAARAGR